LKSTETGLACDLARSRGYFSNFGSLKSTETEKYSIVSYCTYLYFSNFGSLKSTETVFWIVR